MLGRVFNNSFSRGSIPASVKK
ncbi:hypothetical protein H8705_11890 [Oscillospiraceae bacterium NSJ-64]|uniref:Uncharacterized protein n=1 Tax=Youxingia wuxianensis TaxID=2763678 RepID=A0A926ERA6_9FIRM|nr:hypothetical protein [Youxingia wuxianensis]